MLVATAIPTLAGLSTSAVADLAVGNASVVEGNAGTSALRFTLTRDGNLGKAVSVAVGTDDTPVAPATPRLDYSPLPAGKRVLLAPGADTATVTVPVIGDMALEPDETLLLRLSDAREIVTPDFRAPRSYHNGLSWLSRSLTGSQAADIDGDGRPELIASDSADSPLVVFRNRSDGQLKLGQPLVFGSGYVVAEGIVAADLDGDGKNDVAIADYANNSLLLFRNTSSGSALTFAEPVVLGLGSSPSELLRADFNGDGKVDLATVQYSSNSASIFINTSTPGNLRLAAPLSLPVADEPLSAVVGDVDGDGKPDILVGSAGASVVTLLHNVSTASAARFAGIDLPASAFTYQLAMADFDGDGLADIAISLGDRESVQVLRNQSVPGRPDFAALTRLTPTDKAISVLACEIDGDSKPDLVVRTQASSFRVLRNTSTGANRIAFTEGPAETLEEAEGLTDCADFDGDQHNDLTTLREGETISLIRNVSAPGKPRFESRRNLRIISSSPRMATGDVDGDGRPEVFLGEQNSDYARIYRNRSAAGEWELSAAQDLVLGFRPASVALTDLDGDGKADLLYSNESQAGIGVRRSLSTSAGSSLEFAAPKQFSGAYGVTTGFTLVDFDGDGRRDIAGLASVDALSIRRNNSTPGQVDLSAELLLSIDTFAFYAVGDVDGDGRPDLAVAKGYGTGIDIVRNASDSTGIAFETRVPIATTIEFSSAVAMADLDGDGRGELIIGDSRSDTLTVMPGTSSPGSISFGTALSLGRGLRPQSIQAQDLNGDGLPELVVNNPMSVTVFHNRSTAGSLDMEQLDNYGAGKKLWIVSLDDHDGDGQLDFLATDGDGFDLLSGRPAPTVAIATNEAIGTILDDDSDTTPDTFSFAWRFGVAPGSVQTSDEATIRGINSPAPISITGGAYSINGNAFTTAAGTIRAGDTLRVQHSAADYGQTAQTFVTVGGLQIAFASISVPADRNPDSMNFIARAGVQPGVLVTSDPVQIAGIDVAVPVSVSGGEYSINGDSYRSTAGTIRAGDQLRLRHLSGDFGQSRQTIVTVGEGSGSFLSATKFADLLPDTVVFAPQAAVQPGTLVQSVEVRVSGIDAAVAISIIGGEYSIDGGTFTSSASSVNAGARVVVRLRSSATAGDSATAILRLGSLNIPFSVTTAGAGELSGGGGGALPPALLLALLPLALLRRRRIAL